MARKPRTANGTSTQSRDTKGLTSHPKVLIVCEDTKSSLFYINDLVKDLGLQATRVEVIPGKGSAPISVVNTAISRSEPEGEDSFDKVFIVIDRDSHTTFDKALKELDRHNRNASTQAEFYSILSYPSYETWVLYHFTYTRSPMKTSKDVIRKIKKEGFDYKKNEADIFSSTKGRMESHAIPNSAKSIKDAESEQEPNPSTQFHVLIDRLTSIANINKAKEITTQDIVNIIWRAVGNADGGVVVLDNKPFKSLHENVFDIDVFDAAIAEFDQESPGFSVCKEATSVTITLSGEY
ncbi:MAG: hypothetical protein COA42_15205 [Alteromonadaceae bacterium]|nr:MAG: hypothetical protein COA42_15205 [Alteromonadaceae bacterium]